MSEVLLTNETGFLEAEGREKTHHFSQREILRNADIATAAKQFDLELPYGPYYVDYSRNGRHMIVGGEKGQLAMLDCHSMAITCEVQVQESVRNVRFLQNSSLFAVSQRKYTYIYDQQGVEVHCLEDHKNPTCLEYLPYHYLLAIGAEQDSLAYRDISTGQVVAKHKTFLGPTTALRQNRNNAVLHHGSQRGVVSLWTPNVKEPVLKMLCHRGAISCLAVEGNYMVTGATDGKWKVWDIRKYECVNGYRVWGTPPSSIDISMTGIVSVGFGSTVQLWKDALATKAKMPYLEHHYDRCQINDVQFRPFEDVLAVGHSGGFGTLVVPGAGYANYDAYEANPFETKKQRREGEVRKLLEKIQPDTILLDPTIIGSYNERISAVAQSQKETIEKVKKRKNKMRGKQKIGRKMGSKNKEFGKVMKDKMKARRAEEEEAEKEKTKKSKKKKKAQTETIEPVPEPKATGALARFMRKKN